MLFTGRPLVPGLTRAWVAGLLAAAVLIPIGHLWADGALSRREAESFHRKLSLITRHGESGRAGPRATPVSESEVNAYLQFHARDQIPIGIVDPHVRILGDGRLAGRAIVDLDAVRTQRTRGWLDPAGYLTGRLPVSAVGMLRTSNGVGRLEIESAEIAGVAVPKALLQDLVSYYSRTPDHPQGVSLDAPFELPARIREIQVGKGRAVVVQ